MPSQAVSMHTRGQPEYREWVSGVRLSCVSSKVYLLRSAPNEGDVFPWWLRCAPGSAW